MLDPELVEHADDGAAQIVAAVRVVGSAGIAAIRPSSPVSKSPASSAANAAAQRLVVLQAQARGEALGGEGAGHVGEQGERLVAVAAAGQQAGERHGGVGAAGLELERAAQVVLAAGGDERVGLGGHQPVEEALDAARPAGRR